MHSGHQSRGLVMIACVRHHRLPQHPSVRTHRPSSSLRPNHQVFPLLMLCARVALNTQTKGDSTTVSRLFPLSPCCCKHHVHSDRLKHIYDERQKSEVLGFMRRVGHSNDRLSRCTGGEWRRDQRRVAVGLRPCMQRGYVRERTLANGERRRRRSSTHRWRLN